ncbi:hypothetical protein V6N13_015915 [Hibiscus sabdariffa]
MRGRHDASSMYKRGTRDHAFDAYDKEQEPRLYSMHSFLWLEPVLPEYPNSSKAKKFPALHLYQTNAYILHSQDRLLTGADKDIGNPSWKRSLPHVLVATLASFLYGYHLGVINETLESISHDLGFHRNTMAEGLVVSTCLGGAFVGSLFGGLIADGVGRRRAFQLCALPMIIGASMSATAKNLWGMLLGRLFVGTGMGTGPPVAALYVTEVSPAYVRGTYGSFTQIATGLGLLGSLFIGFPAKETEGWWRMCFWASVAPAAILALFMEFCAESPHWLFKRGRGAEAEAEYEKLLGGPYVKSAIAELSKSDRGDDADTFKFSELLYGHHRKVVFIGSTLFALQQLSGSFIAMILMDKLGRKVLLIGSFSGMVRKKSFCWFVLAFAIGAGPVPSILLSEMFPGRVRANAVSICMAFHWRRPSFQMHLVFKMDGEQALESCAISLCCLSWFPLLKLCETNVTSVFVTDGEFLCWPVIFAVAGADWTISPEFNFRIYVSISESTNITVAAISPSTSFKTSQSPELKPFTQIAILRIHHQSLIVNPISFFEPK